MKSAVPLLARSLLLALISAVASAQAPTPLNDDVKARATYEAARDAYEGGHFAEALSLFERALALSGRKEIEFDIARAAEADGRDAVALQAYERYLAAAPNAPNRTFAEARVRRLRKTGAGARQAGDLRGEPRSSKVEGRGQVAASAPTDSRPLVQLPAEPYRPARRVFQLYGGLALGVASTAEGESDGDYAYTGWEEYDYGASFGLQAGLAWVWRIFGLGAELRAAWYGQAEGLDGSDLVLQEFLLKPRLGYKLASLPLELYAALPHGMSRLAFGAEHESKQAAFSVGLTLGASYFISEHLGINAELGYTWRGTLGGWPLDWMSDFTLFRVSALFGL